jgi:hypothetical protein
MAIGIPRALVEYILLGPPDDRRQLQDSPILGDVWIAFAREPDRQLDLLITPFKTQTAGSVAVAIEGRLERSAKDDPNIAFLQGIVAARLYFHEILRAVVPMTGWWHSPRTQQELRSFSMRTKGLKSSTAPSITSWMSRRNGTGRRGRPTKIVAPPWTAMLPSPA